MIHDYNDQPLTNCHGGSTVLKILAHNALDRHETRNRKKKKKKLRATNESTRYLFRA